MPARLGANETPDPRISRFFGRSPCVRPDAIASGRAASLSFLRGGHAGGGGKQQELNAIDRKIYLVSRDILGSSGTAADALRNIPSVDVDIDGNVSLRGSSNVQVLIDGRTSALMHSTSIADVLSQYPADAIDRIEVITNPSAKHKPDGSAGIINIVLKKKRPGGTTGSVRITVGTSGRSGLGMSGGTTIGKFGLSGFLTMRQDDRSRAAKDTRTYADPTTGLPASTRSATYEHGRPVFQVGQASADYKPTQKDTFTETLNYSNRTWSRYGTEADQTAVGSAQTLYERLRYDPEYERDAETRTSYEHRFGEDDDAFRSEIRWAHHTETEDNHYTDLYVSPAAATTLDHLRIQSNDPETEELVEYSRTLSGGSHIEAGIDHTDDRRTANHLGESAAHSRAESRWQPPARP